MCGLALAFTPQYTGRVSITVSGNFINGAAGTATFQLNYGTGTAPINGAAASGTTLGSAISTTSTTNVNLSMSSSVLLTAGTAYWFDLRQTSSIGTDTVAATSLVATISEF